MHSFLDLLDKYDREEMEKYRIEILHNDNRVIEKPSKIMNTENALVYEEEAIFKYGLAKTKNHYTFHSMVMYSNPEVFSFVKENFKAAKIQKGCINFKSFNQLPIDIFSDLMTLSAKMDFSPVIRHYKERKK